MPRIDPITGCHVMTLPEFLNEEGAREGKTGGEVLDEIFQSLEDDNRSIETEWRKPEVALETLRPMLKNAYDAWVDTKDWYEKNPMTTEMTQFIHGEWVTTPAQPQVFDDPEPINPENVVRVTEVTAAEHRQSFGGASGMLSAKLELKDGSIKHVRAKFWNDYGNRMNPPDGDEEIEEITE